MTSLVAKRAFPDMANASRRTNWRAGSTTVQGPRLDFEPNPLAALALACGAWCCAMGALPSDAADYPIQPVPLGSVSLSGGLWGTRLKTNREVTVPYTLRKCEETGRIANFAVAGKLEPGGFRGIFFNDSDVFKVIEGVAYSLAQHPDPALEAELDSLIAKIAAAQEADGYLYTARTIADGKYDFPGRQTRWSALQSSHELYNVGHLYEAAVAHWQATGKRTLLNVALRNADLVCQVFGSGEKQKIDVPGHQEIELGLVRLYRATGEEKYLRQAKFFIDMRGQAEKRSLYGAYCQDHQPVIAQQEAVGHAVRAGYLYAGMADVAALTAEDDYVRAIDRLWENIVGRKMYLTGGVGALREGEAFGANYELPNESAYNETCAAIAQALLNHRMFLLHGDSKYVDVLERILYNGFLAGVSFSGDRFFYPNPLAANGRTPFNQGQAGRSPWFGCSCCPVNVVRFIPSIAGYVYAVRDRDIYLNLYAEGTGQISLEKQRVTLRQQTRYPWEGSVRVTVEVPEATEFALHVRIPQWCQGQPMPGDLYRYEGASNANFTLRLNGKNVRDEVSISQGYAVVKRSWQTGDVVELELPLPVRRVRAHEAVVANRGRVALERGPLVYCFEGVDNEGSVADLVLPIETEWHLEPRADLVGGVTALRGTAQRVVADGAGQRTLREATVVAVPYFAWSHREPGPMAVWLAADSAIARPSVPPTLASTSRVSASHVWRDDTLAALHDQEEPESSGDHSIPRHTWWDHRGTSEWVQYDFPRPAEVREVDVYWFDDTGRGQCRVPRDWRVLYRQGDEWKPVRNLEAYGVAADQWNRVRFEGVTTAAVRLEVELREEFSAGVLEWRVR